ncbi:MAG: hypothetical protein AABX29_02035 [Nanoarchaeota archaeon]
MEKKGIIQEMGKFLIAIAVLVFLLILLYLSGDKLYSVAEKLMELVTYG